LTNLNSKKLPFAISILKAVVKGNVQIAVNENSQISS